MRWARDHLPDDAEAISTPNAVPNAGLRYQGRSPEGDMGCAYDKESNRSENDSTDLIN